MPDGLTHGPISERTLHLCVDMQRMFADDTAWHTPWMARVAPVVRRLVERDPARTIFTRFIPPRRAEDVPGSWRRYYEDWPEFTRERIDPGLLELIPELAPFAPPAVVVDKPFYSPFVASPLAQLLRARDADGVIVTGAETDVCVLAAVIDAVDRGYRVILPTDGLCSSSDETHDALLTVYRHRFSKQIETCRAEDILAAWR